MALTMTFVLPRNQEGCPIILYGAAHGVRCSAVLPESSLHHVGGPVLLGLPQVGVDVQRDRRLRVTEPHLYLLRCRPVLDQHRGVEVPEVVQRRALGYTGFAACLREMDVRPLDVPGP